MDEEEKAYILSEIEKWKERKEFALGIPHREKECEEQIRLWKEALERIQNGYR